MQGIYKKLIIIGIGLCSCFGLRAQDIHFSQFYALPIFQNPAFTGYFNGDIRATADFRMQWETFGNGFGNAFRTAAVSADLGLLRGQTASSTLGVGLTFVNDQAGDLDLSTNQVGLAMSYVQGFGRNATNFIGFGFHGTWSQRSLDLTDAIFPDQIETDLLNNYNYFNLSAGLLWFFEPNDVVNMYFGAAMHNIIKPNVSFFDGVEEGLDRRITAQFGSKFDVSRNISLVPSVLFQKQGPSQELILGTFLRYAIGGFTANTKTTLQFGAFYRFSDAIIPVLRVDYQEFSFIFSYDINMSKLSAASRGEGAAEISITYTGNVFSKGANQKPLRCPIL